MKYVRCRLRGIFIFPLKTRHEQMRNWVGGDIVSAGFIGQKDGEFYCYGNSSTLRIGSLPEDTEVLREQMELCLAFI